ncbi:hypothetical protein SAMN04488123_12233 [Natribacillus halophilus]|uniref:Uncharacterized protein n=1 Tax=Natribacillus halophilus TaxID=549003 RepID=A0A1G8S4R7_9BACI|nr:hypothetical protein SAMN04488123_12233 [Natribacillus halophilus]
MIYTVPFREICLAISCISISQTLFGKIETKDALECEKR